ncbi:hypothetical protein EDC04DRAFT_3033004 [Pisolithus marmoratus]|nr:hypothetical protein EDC04DRAFT_3033004 [Pisolithus marmoratus]
MSDLYKNESERIDNVGKVLTTFDNYRYVIAEFKNEAGNTSGEPYFQSIGYYLESTRRKRSQCQVLPCHVSSSPFSVCFRASTIRRRIDPLFAGALRHLCRCRMGICVQRYNCCRCPLHLISIQRNTDNLLVLARHMAAFRKATQTLKRYYEDLRPTQPLQNMPSPQLFPYPTITSSYSSRSWIESASSSPGGIHLTLTNIAIYARKPAGPRSHQESYSRETCEISQRRFVHGDIRDTNIMVSKSDNTQFRIIDLTGAGIAGEVKYPAFLNPEVRRPEGASDGKPILAEHDDAMLMNALVFSHGVRSDESDIWGCNSRS